MGLIGDLFMSWKVCSVVFCRLNHECLDESFLPDFQEQCLQWIQQACLGRGHLVKIHSKQRTKSQWSGKPAFFSTIFVPPDYPRTFEEFVVEETIMVDSMHGPPRCIFSFLAFVRFKVFSCFFLETQKSRHFQIIPRMLDTLRDCWWKKSGQHHLGCIIPVENIMAINNFASWPDFWSIRRITKKLLERFAQNSIKLRLEFLQTRATSESTGIFNQRFLEVGNSTLWAAGAAGCLRQAERRETSTLAKWKSPRFGVVMMIFQALLVWFVLVVCF